MFILLTTSNIKESDFNDNEYVTNLYKKYGKTLWKYAYSLSQNNEMADDLVSATFLKIIEKIDIIKKVHRYKTKSYLMSIVRNSYFNYLNKEKLTIDIDNILEYSCFDTDNDFTERISVSEVEETLNHMPELQKLDTDKSWVTVSTWTKEGTTKYADYQYRAVSRGTYRVTVTAKVYNSSGSLVETQSVYSITDTY